MKNISNSSKIFMLCILLLLAVAPLLVSDYVLSIMILTLYLAYIGQAWNLMMGFAGQLSLGHSLYVGLGGYFGAALFVHYGISPWIGIVAGAIVCGIVGAIIAFLGLRFSIKGVHFALLTIAFAESTRILFDHLSWFGASGGLFIPVESHQILDVINLRGKPLLFYYVFLGLCLGALVICGRLIHTRLGYAWLALREEPEAAQALGINLFRTKIIAVSLSAAMTGVGGVIYAFYQNSLFPEQTFAMHKSVEFLMGPIVGGVGTLLGPIIGAFLLTPLGEILSDTISAMNIYLPGLKHMFYGGAMLFIMLFFPEGLWPVIKNKTKLSDRLSSHV
jgi:branched-chain amino acid transport system permease protein